jgi:hypothetical protein
MSDFKRLIQWAPAYDRRHPDPSKNYGIHGVEMRWVLCGERGAVHLLVYTNWMLPHVRPKEHSPLLCGPMPTDLGYHAPTRDKERGECEYLEGRPCIYEGSSLESIPVFETLVREGEEACWGALADYYHRVFDRKIKRRGVKK